MKILLSLIYFSNAFLSMYLFIKNIIFWNKIDYLGKEISNKYLRIAFLQTQVDRKDLQIQALQDQLKNILDERQKEKNFQNLVGKH